MIKVLYVLCVREGFRILFLITYFLGLTVARDCCREHITITIDFYHNDFTTTFIKKPKKKCKYEEIPSRYVSSIFE